MDELGKVHLRSPVDVVRCSFLVQKSLTPLDLGTLEFSSRKRTIFTEEGFQKLFGVKDRRVLFKYHLDISHGLEKALIGYDPFFEFSTNKFESSVYRGVKVSEDYDDIIFLYMKTAIQKSGNKIAKLKKLFPLMKMIQLSLKKWLVFDYIFFARILQEECIDSVLVAEFLEVCGKENFFDFLLNSADFISAKYIEYFLHHSQKMKIELQFKDCCCPVSRGMLEGNFGIAITLIKYGKMRQPLNDEDVRYHVDEISNNSITPMNWITIYKGNSDEYELCFGSMSRVKKWLFLLLVSHFWQEMISDSARSVTLGIQALRLLWRSLPVPYLTLSEIQSVWRKGCQLTADHVYTLYETEIIDGGNRILDKGGPRSLQHLARCEIRGRLAANCALPDGIELLGLPQPIQGFLCLGS